MARISRYCRLTGKQVLRDTNPDRAVAAVGCPEYQLPAGTCGIKRDALATGKLHLLLSMASDSAIDGGLDCPLR